MQSPESGTETQREQRFRKAALQQRTTAVPPSNHPMTPTEIEKMSLPDRLAAMESLWASLQGGDRPLASPAWHRTLLAERQRKLRAGKAVFQSLSEVRARLLR